MKTNRFHITYTNGLEETECSDLLDAEAVANQKFGLTLEEVEANGAKITLLPDMEDEALLQDVVKDELQHQEQVEQIEKIVNQEGDSPEFLKIN